MHCDTVQCNAMRRSAMRCVVLDEMDTVIDEMVIVMRCRTIRCDTIQCNTISLAGNLHLCPPVMLKN